MNSLHIEFYNKIEGRRKNVSAHVVLHSWEQYTCTQQRRSRFTTQNNNTSECAAIATDIVFSDAIAGIVEW